jgi:hypothetical protein
MFVLCLTRGSGQLLLSLLSYKSPGRCTITIAYSSFLCPTLGIIFGILPLLNQLSRRVCYRLSNHSTSLTHSCDLCPMIYVMFTCNQSQMLKLRLHTKLSSRPQSHTESQVDANVVTNDCPCPCISNLLAHQSALSACSLLRGINKGCASGLFWTP